MEKIGFNKHIKYYSTIKNSEERDKLSQIKVNVLYSSRNYRKNNKNKYNNIISNYQNLSVKKDKNDEKVNNRYINNYKNDETKLNTYDSVYEIKTFSNPIGTFTSRIYKKEPKITIKMDEISNKNNYEKIEKDF